ncbi:MAG TPA: hypothetical protein VGM51_00385 [Armatimonadota bacterium]
MKLLRSIALTVAAATIGTASFAQANCKKPSTMPAPVISKVTAFSFTLKQISTKTLDDVTSTGLYKGSTILIVTSADAAVSPIIIPVEVELRTQTVLNKNGDGLTDGVITMFAPNTRKFITGPMTAVNENFGDLTGVIEGRFGGVGVAQARLRAVFHGVFVQDSTGAYTDVNVDARGVILEVPQAGGRKN